MPYEHYHHQAAVLAAIQSGLKKRSSIVEATGLEERKVSLALRTLLDRNQIERRKGRFLPANGKLWEVWR